MLVPVAAVLASLLTAISTLIGVHITSRNNERQLTIRLDYETEQRNQEFRNSRLEELYALSQKWSGTVIAHFALYRKVMDGERDYNQALDVTIESKSNFDASRLFMIADLYFPESHILLEHLKSSWDRCAEIEADYREIYKQKGPSAPGMKFSEVLTEAMHQFNTCSDAYQSKLREIALRNIT
jgi:hypothetical protein